MHLTLYFYFLKKTRVFYNLGAFENGKKTLEISFLLFDKKSKMKILHFLRPKICDFYMVFLKLRLNYTIKYT